MTPRLLRCFRQEIQLPSDEWERLETLVWLSRASPESEREELQRELAAGEAYRIARKLHQDPFYSTWYTSVIRELATLEGFQADPGWVAAALRPPISVAEATDALQMLRDMGLLVETEDGALQADTGTVATQEYVRPELLGAFYAQMNDLARATVEKMASREDPALYATSWVGGLTLRVPEDGIEEIGREFVEFQKRLFGLVEAMDGPCNRVLQLYQVLFPVSGRVDPEQ